MSSIDDRIVNMKFNNSEFRPGVAQTRADLKTLEQSITSAGRSKGMTELGTSADGVRMKFSALQVAGVAALSTIVSKATMAAGNFIKKFTFGPAIAGFQEYQTNLESIQTIMSNTGKDVDTVNDALDKMNKYSDQTIYNFSEMARNVGTFTAAGVKLDVATSAIQGIANVAAMSGSTSDQASRAMYQLSQAIAAGRVSLQDWNSVVNAGMGGKNLQTALAQTAVAMGDLDGKVLEVGDKVKIMGQSFRESISLSGGGESWLSGDVLTKTLAVMDGRFASLSLKAEGFKTKQQQIEEIEKRRNALAKEGVVYTDEQFKSILKMADASYKAATQIKTFPQLISVIEESLGSMYSQSFRLILGNFQQSKKLWTAVGEVITGPKGIISKMSGSFLGALRHWKREGGRRDLLEGLKSAFTSLGSVLKTIKQAFKDVFPPGASDALISFTSGFRSFFEAIEPSESTLKNLRSIFGGLFAVLHIGISVLKGLGTLFTTVMKSIFKATGGARGGILDFAGTIGETLKAIDRFLTGGGRMTAVFETIGKSVGIVIQAVGSVGNAIGGALTALLSGNGIDGIVASIGPLGIKITDLGSRFTAFLSEVTSGFAPVSNFFADISVKLAEWRRAIVLALAGATSSMKDVNAPLASIKTIFDNMVNAVKDFASSFDLSFGRVEDTIDEVHDKVSGMYDSMGNSTVVEDSTSKVTTVVGKGQSVLAAFANGLKKIGESIRNAISWVGDLFKKIPFPDDALEWGMVLNGLVSAVGLLAGGALIKKLFFTKSAFRVFVESISDSIEEIGGAIKQMKRESQAEMLKNFAISIGIMAASLAVLSMIPREKLLNGAAAISILGGLLMGFFKTMTSSINAKDGVFKTLAVSEAIDNMGDMVLKLGEALALMAVSVALLGMMDSKKLFQGLAAVTLILGLMVLTLKNLSNINGDVVKAAGALVLVAFAINVLVGAITVLGFLPWEVVAQGLGMVAIGLAIMTGALFLLSKSEKATLSAGAAMVMMAFAMDVLVASIVTLGLLPWKVVEQGLVAVAYGMAIMVIALALLSTNGDGVLKAAAALIIMSIALQTFMGIVVLMGTLPWDVIQKGLIAVGIGLGLLIVAAFLAEKVLPGMLALTAILSAIAAVLLAAGAGFFLFASGLAILATIGAAAIGVISLALHTFMAMIPTFAIQMAAGFVTFIETIAKAAPRISKAFGKIFNSIIDTIINAQPKIRELFMSLLQTVLDLLVGSATKFATAGYKLIYGLLVGMNQYIPNIITAATDLVVNFLGAMGKNARKITEAATDFIVDIIEALEAAIEGSDRIRDAAKNLAATFVDEFKETAKDLFPSWQSVKGWLGFGGDDSGGGGGGSPRTSAGSGGRAANAPMGRSGLNWNPELQTLTTMVKNAMGDIANAISSAITNMAETASGTLWNMFKDMQNAQSKATRLSAEASVMSTGSTAMSDAASDMRAAADDKREQAKKKKTSQARRKKLNKEAKKLDKKAKKLAKKSRAQARAAEIQASKAAQAQLEADIKEQNAQNAKLRQSGDLTGYADAEKSQSIDLAQQSDEAYQAAQAKRDEAARLEKLADKGGKNAQKLREQAAKLRREAAADTHAAVLLANEAIDSNTAAVEAYREAVKAAAAEITTQIEDLQKALDEADAQRQWEKDYEAATDEQKKQMLQDRIAKNEQKEDAAREELRLALERARELQKKADSAEGLTDAEKAELEALVAKAKDAADSASEAADDIEADKDAIEQLTGGSSGSSSSSNSSITPSKSVLEDAAKAIDRYTASVAKAEYLAQASAQPNQFIQNNYSPTALSTTDIYRRSKNLISISKLS